MKKIKAKHIIIALVAITIIYYFYKKTKNETKAAEVNPSCSEDKILEQLTAEEQSKLSEKGYIFNKMMIINREEHDKSILEKRKKCGYNKDVVAEYMKKYLLNK